MTKTDLSQHDAPEATRENQETTPLAQLLDECLGLKRHDNYAALVKPNPPPEGVAVEFGPLMELLD